MMKMAWQEARRRVASGLVARLLSPRARTLIELTLARFREFTREPEAVFWVFVFPILLAFALGIAVCVVLAVLSYHSGENRIVKNVFRALAASGYQEAHRKPLSPREQEVRDNPRSRSAQLRVLERL